MFKLTFILSLMIIGTLVWAYELSDDCKVCLEVCEKQYQNVRRKREAHDVWAVLPIQPSDCENCGEVCPIDNMRRKRESEANMFLAPVGDAPYTDNVVQAFAENAHQNRLYPNDVPASTFY